MRTCMLSLLVFFTFGTQATELFFIPWNAKESQLSYQSEGDWRMGPQAIGVDEKGQVYILDRLGGRVVVFTGDGAYQKSLDCQAEGCGLAVSPNGTVAVFSPSAKTVTWINGAMAGSTVVAKSFPALSEVWFQQGAWRGRCGWQTCTLQGERDDCPMPSVFATSENEIALRMSGTRENLVTLQIPETFFNVWAMGSLCDSERLCVVLRANGGFELFTCDLKGNRSQSLYLEDSWTEVFCPYAIAPDGSLYQLVTDQAGISVQRFSEFSQTTRKATISRRIPQNLRDFLDTPSQTQSNSRSIPESINVYFRNEGKVRRVRLQDYLKGVVSAEIYGNWLLEAHKAMAVAARTYSLAYTRHPNTSPKAMVCTSTHCQAWTSNIGWKAAQAVDSTNGVVVYYKGVRIREALYFSHCNGHTRNSEEKWNYIPYLRRKPCPCGYTSFFGHGVGVCQWGLQAYAKKGWNYVDILQHYYSGTSVKK